ncbi:HNH endonuclease [Arthrobacter sp. zg-Y769]|nr:HNH endonuclease [Arthrobacter sp. zg-Y769]
MDHTLPFAHGGATEHSNLAHLCRKHHRLKTLGHWQAHRDATGPAGALEWTSPLGRTYRTTPQLHLRTGRMGEEHPDAEPGSPGIERPPDWEGKTAEPSTDVPPPR